MTRLFVEPFDLWLFRDGRPFAAQTDHHARSLFPPTPLTVYGALRSRILMAAAGAAPSGFSDDAWVESIVGRPDDFNRLAVRGPWVAKRGAGEVTRYLPAPLDLVARDGAFAGRAQPENSWRLLTPRQGVPGLVADNDLALPWSAEPYCLSDGAYLSEADFFAVLGGIPRPALPASVLFGVEPRAGVALAWHDSGGPRRVARQGHLYSVGFIRPHSGVGLCVDIDGEAAPAAVAEGLMGLGGEARASRVEVVAARAPSTGARRAQVAAAGRFRLTLVTPALFAAGWLPSWVDPATRQTLGNYPGLRLVTAAVGRALPIGGFDVVKNRPRSTILAVPAGSVYWFEQSEDGAAARMFDRLDGGCVSDEMASIGFGQCYAGVW